MYVNIAASWRKLIMGNRGRPKGYIMSDASRIKISEKLRGRRLTDEHKRKISISMMGNQNRVNPNKKNFLDDMYDEYVENYSDENVGRWIHEHSDDLLTSSGIISEYTISSLSFIEINVEDVSNVLSDSLTPEIVMNLMPDYIEVLQEVFSADS